LQTRAVSHGCRSLLTNKELFLTPESETRDEINKIDVLVQDVSCNHILGLVVAGLPYKTCLSSGTPPEQDPWNYLESFISPIASKIKEHSSTAFAIILEPGVLPNYALSPGDTCQHVKKSWYRNIPNALKMLDLPNVVMYLDGGHGGIFGWTGRSWEGTTKAPEWFHQNEGTPLQGATELTQTWKAAGPLSQFRGLAINVRNYNAW
jgi:cellulose 1,4-beta-cellobiosidase